MADSPAVDDHAIVDRLRRLGAAIQRLHDAREAAEYYAFPGLESHHPDHREQVLGSTGESLFERLREAAAALISHMSSCDSTEVWAWAARSRFDLGEILRRTRRFLELPGSGPDGWPEDGNADAERIAASLTDAETLLELTVTVVTPVVWVTPQQIENANGPRARTVQRACKADKIRYQRIEERYQVDLDDAIRLWPEFRSQLLTLKS